MKFIFTLLAILISMLVQAQNTVTISGTAKIDDGKPLQNATVLLYTAGGKDTLRSITNIKGVYRFLNVKPGKTGIIISYIGYKKFNDVYDNTAAKGEAVIPDIIMTPGDNMLETVTLESSRVQIKEDTVSYKVDSTMYRKNDNVEAIIKNLPGVQVDKDGKITAQGKEVTKVKVNGKEFFGGDVKTATRDLNADMVDKIQIIDDYGDQSAFTGVKDGDPTKTLNIQLKKDKNKGYFGTASAGAGTQDRYLASLSVNKFKGNQQLSLTGNINNTNANTFDFGSLPGGMGAIAGSMMRSFGGIRGGSGSNFFGGNSDGIGIMKSIGANYRDDWSPKISAYGSYSFSEKTNTLIADINQQNVQADSTKTFTNNQSNKDYSITDNHRFSFNIEYKVDSFNYIKFNPTVTYRKINDNYRSDFNYFNNKGAVINTGFNTDMNESKTPNYSGNILYNHRFHKKGRTLSLNFTAGKSTTDATDDIFNQTTYPQGLPVIDQFISQNNDNHNYGVTASFNEQLSKKRSLEFNYAFNKRFIRNDKETFDVNGNIKTLVDSLTNIYENIYITNRFGINFRTVQKKYNYTIGVAIQPATIESNSFTKNATSYKQNLVNFFPVIRVAYNFSRSRSFNLNYNGSTNQPTYQQSQPVYDYSNRQNIILGNPDLKPEFSNTFSMRYNNFNFVSGDVFFSNLSASFTKDKIVSNIIPRDRGIQETRYLNANGYYNVNAFYTVSKPLQNRKYVFNIGGNINYNNNISYLNFQKNKGNNFVISQRFSIDYKIKKWLETSGGINYSLNDNKYSLSSYNNSKINSISITHSSRMFFKHDVNFSYDLDKSINSGYANSVSANPLIINATLEKQLFKKKNSSLKLQAFDLLNENISVSRSVTGNAITDTRTNRLGRYVMLSFVLRLNKFSGTQQGGQMTMPGGGMRMMGGSPPGM